MSQRNNGNRKLLVEYTLDELGRITNSTVLDKTPDVSYSELAGVIDNETIARSMLADYHELSEMDTGVIPHAPIDDKPVIAMGTGKHVFTWNYEDCPMGIIVSQSSNAREHVLATIRETLPNSVQFISTVTGHEREIISEVLTVMMERYERMEAAGVNNWGLYTGKQGDTDKTLMLAVSIDSLPFQPDVDSMITSIIRLGRAAGVHMVLAMRTVEGTPGELLENIGLRVVMGQCGMLDSVRLLDSTVGTMIPEDTRYGIIKVWRDVKTLKLVSL